MAEEAGGVEGEDMELIGRVCADTALDIGEVRPAHNFRNVSQGSDGM